MHQSRRLYTCCWKFYFYFFLFIALVGLCPCLFSIYRRNHRYFFHLPKYSDCVLIWKNCGKINKQLSVISSAQCSLCLILSSQSSITYQTQKNIFKIFCQNITRRKCPMEDHFHRTCQKLYGKMPDVQYHASAFCSTKV